jgi:hypothetical protein
MAKANQETCPHPATKLATVPSFGHTQCLRCDADLTPSNRSFDYRAAERTTFTQGDRVHVKGTAIMPSYKGTFQWAECDADGVAQVYCVCEKQLYKEGDGPKARTVEGTAAIRWPHPDLVRHDDGVRTRRAREEEQIARTADV